MGAGLRRVLADVAATYKLRRDDFVAVIDGMEMDAAADIRAPALAELDLYCDRVASAVGRLSVRIFGTDVPAADRVAGSLGRALQLPHILPALADAPPPRPLPLPPTLSRGGGGGPPNVGKIPLSPCGRGRGPTRSGGRVRGVTDQVAALRRVHVVGAGLAGLAASLRLAEAGVAVVLHEAARQAGGRCRSYDDTTLGCRIDNGNHLLIAGNTATMDYLRAIRAAATLIVPDA